MNIGIVAGEGPLPLWVAKKARTLGFVVYGYGFDQTDGRLSNFVKELKISHSFEITPLIDFFISRDVKEILLTGRINPLQFLNDPAIMKELKSLNDKRPTVLFSVLSEKLTANELKILPLFDFVKELIPMRGQLTKNKPTSEEFKDIEFGFQIAKKLAQLDIGMSVTIKNGVVLSVESIGGTDKCILDGGRYARDILIVKVARPNQDWRFDPPVVGMKTIKVISSVGGRVLAIEAGNTVVLDQPDIFEFADNSGISIVAV